MFTDMVGYTALGQRNESLSIALVQEQRKIIRPLLAKHAGKEVKTMGDAFLVEFQSALDAVRCAYDIQRAAREFNFSLPPDSRVHLRIGVHLGDVVESQGDISGDAVNVASRIEPLAADGGVCITQQVYDQVSNKFELPFIDLGEKSLKNVSKPVGVYGVQMPWEVETKTAPRLDTKRIAVLPFANMSPDSGDSYFADGITEEIITTLSSVRELMVISRTSVMGYRATTKRAREIGNELEVGSILEGSFRKSGRKIRVTTQLIDVPNDRHVWAQNYDRELDDVFAIQSEIAEKVVETLKVKLLTNEAKLVERPATKSTEAYSTYLKGRHLLSEGTDNSLRQALELFTEAAKIDPQFARAHIGVGECYSRLGTRSYISMDESVSGTKSAAKKALEIDPDLAEGHYLLALVAWAEDDHVLDEKEAKKAVELNLNLAEAHLMLGMINASNGYLAEAIGRLETAHSLDPLNSQTIEELGFMYVYAGRDQDLLEFCNRNRATSDFSVSMVLVDYYTSKGDYKRAEDELARFEAKYPNDFSAKCWRGYLSALQGDKIATEKIMRDLQKEFSGGATLERSIGYMKYFLGDMEGFYSAMLHAADEHVIDPVVLRFSPLFREARKDPRYREVLIKSGLDPGLIRP